MIKFEKVTKIFKTKSKKEVLALDDISFEIKEKELVLLCGRSGAGKTTILKLILGQEKPTSGKIFFEGKEILKKRDILNLRRKVGIIFQDLKLLGKKNVFENLAFVMEVAGLSQRKIKREIPEILDLVGLREKIDFFPEELSQGEKQKLAIARAICHRPKLLLADEPTGNLDSFDKVEILKILKRINDLGTTLILTTHDKEVAQFFNSRILLLEKGKLVKDGRGVFLI